MDSYQLEYGRARAASDREFARATLQRLSGSMMAYVQTCGSKSSFKCTRTTATMEISGKWAGRDCMRPIVFSANTDSYAVDGVHFPLYRDAVAHLNGLLTGIGFPEFDVETCKPFVSKFHTLETA